MGSEKEDIYTVSFVRSQCGKAFFDWEIWTAKNVCDERLEFKSREGSSVTAEILHCTLTIHTSYYTIYIIMAILSYVIKLLSSRLNHIKC